MLQIDSKTYVISAPWLKKILKFSPSKCLKLTQRLTKNVIDSEQVVSRIHAEYIWITRRKKAHNAITQTHVGLVLESFTISRVSFC